MTGSGRWDISCSLSFASCRLRAEALARQLHSSLWVSRGAHISDDREECSSPCFGKTYHHPIVSSPPRSNNDKSIVSNHKYTMFCESQGTEECPSPPSPAEETEEDEEASMYHSPINVASSKDLGLSEVSKCIGELTSLTLEDRTALVETDNTDDSSNLATCDKENAVLADELYTKLRHYQTHYVNGRSVPSQPESPDYSEESKAVSNGVAHAIEISEEESISETSDTSQVSKPASLPVSDTLSSINSETSNFSSSREELYLGIDSPEEIPKLIRSTSLKTGKTPPGTPRRKKIVKFADALGLDLEAVKHIMTDDIPNIPASAFSDLNIKNEEKRPKTAPADVPVWEPATLVISAPMTVPVSVGEPKYTVCPQFSQPSSDPGFMDRVRMQKVCLENISVLEFNIRGVVRVLNISYDKKVVIRYTTSEWATFEEHTASYVAGSCDGFSDKFTFNINLPYLSDGQRVVFAVRFIANGQEFWDNNKESNYVLRCLVDTSRTDPSVRWLHHFM